MIQMELPLEKKDAPAQTWSDTLSAPLREFQDKWAMVAITPANFRELSEHYMRLTIEDRNAFILFQFSRRQPRG